MLCVRSAEALGRLQHPGIAQIYEAGTADTDFGPQPYLAMEFIRGLPLKQYAEAHHLSAHERLRLMEEVCDTQSMLGAALEAQKKFGEAEPLLVSGYEGMSSRQPNARVTGRFTLDQAGQAVMKLYMDWGKPEKASEWRARLTAVTQTKPRP